MMVALLKSTTSSFDEDQTAALDERESFAAFVGDDVTRELVARVAEGQGWSSAAIEQGGAADCVRTFGVLPPPRILLVDLTASENATQDMSTLRNVVGPETAVIVIGGVNDVGLYHALAEAGAADYLVKPVTPEALLGALKRSEQPAASQTREVRRGRVIFVTGARGGVGASTVALNTAWIMAHEFGQRTVLLDLDLQFGTASLGLDLEPGGGLREALECPDRLDELFIERAMTRESESLFVLGSEEPLDSPPSYDADALDQLLTELRGRFDRLVVDIPRSVLAEKCGILPAADEVVVVSDPTLAALRDTLRLKRFVAGFAPEAKLSIVANRVGRSGQLSLKEFERGLDGSVSQAVPYEEAVAAKSANLGHPIIKVARRSKTAQMLRRMSFELNGAQQAPKKRKRKK